MVSFEGLPFIEVNLSFETEDLRFSGTRLAAKF
jgi:hypothetical protein